MASSVARMKAKTRSVLVKSPTLLQVDGWWDYERLRWDNRRLPEPLRTVMSVEGMIGAEQAEVLFDLAAAADPAGCIVEVGSFRGRSTVALALGSQYGAGAAVYAVEPHEPFDGVISRFKGGDDREAFMRNVLRSHCTSTVRLVNLPSVQVAASWAQPISLLFLDGDHTFEGVRRDFEAWSPHLADGGTLVLDDTDLDGPRLLLEKVLAPEGWTVSQAVGRMQVLASPGSAEAPAR